MLKKILFVLAFIIIAFVVVVSMQPSEFTVSRSDVFSAAPEQVFPHVNNLQNWQAWSPWAELDPKATSTFEGPVEGQGAVMKWMGDHNVGEGSMTITESVPSESVRFQLDFVKPFKGTNTAEFTFKPLDEQTLVTWTMSGQKNFVSKAVGLFMNCEKMVGGQFEKGLVNLKTVVETKK